jgi:hypothetical protein
VVLGAPDRVEAERLGQVTELQLVRVDLLVVGSVPAAWKIVV